LDNLHYGPPLQILGEGDLSPVIYAHDLVINLLKRVNDVLQGQLSFPSLRMMKMQIMRKIPVHVYM